jgi:adenylate kinase
MRNIFQSTKSGVKRSWAGPVIGAIAALALTASAVLPAQATEASNGPFVVMIGAPGSGKSTVSAYIAESKGVEIIEVGQLLRDEIAAASKSTAAGKPGSKRAHASAKRLKNIEMAKEQLEAGNLVDGQAIDGALAAGVLSPDAANGFVLDGYPGTVSQAEFLDALMAARGIVPMVIYLDVSDKVALERMQSRGRVDDKSGFAEKHLKLFRKNMAPLLDFYEDGGLYTVDANKGVAEVLKQVDKVLSSN